MEIVERTPDRLILSNKPWLQSLSMIAIILMFVGVGIHLASTGEVFGGVMFMLIGGGVGSIAFMAFTRRTQAIFDVPSDTLTLRTRSVLGFKERQFPLSDIDSAYLEAPQDSDSKGLYRPTLTMKPGASPEEVPVLLVFTSGRGPKRATDTINDWLAGRT